MTVHDAHPGDIYRDREGRIWHVYAICPEPTVYVEELTAKSSPIPLLPRKQSGGVSGQMWDGFVKLGPQQ